MRKLLSQIGPLARSKRVLLIVFGSVALGIAFFLESWPSVVLGLVGIAGYGVVLLSMSIRLHDLNRQIKTRPGFEMSPDVVDDADDGREQRDAGARLEQAVTILRSAGTAREGRVEGRGDRPLVTVVVPCYNEERFVAETLESLRLQTFEDFECIIVDDASTDNSLREIWKVARSDQRFRVLRHAVNSGLGAARNTGLRAARGEFISFLDSDDMLMSESLIDRIVSLHNARIDPHVIGAYCGVRVEVEEVRLEDLPTRMGGNKQTVIDFVSADSECPFNAHAPLLLTEKVRALGGFDESMRHGAEDWDLWYRAMRNGYVFVPSRWITAIYRQKRQSMVRAMPDGHMREADRLIAAAYSTVDPEVLTAPTENPFPEPLPFYRERIHKADRAIRFAAMAVANGDDAAAARTLQAHEGVSLNVLARHVDIPDLVRRGMRRALALRPEELDAFDNTVEAATAEITGLLHRGDESRYVRAEPEAPRVALVVQHAGQLRQMLQMVRDRQMANDRLAVIDVSRESGHQGAVEGLPHDIPSYSLNEWVLRNLTADIVLVGGVRVWTAELIAVRMAASGAEVVEVPQHHEAVMMLDEAQREPIAESRWKSFSLVGTTPPHGGDIAVDPAETWAVEEFPLTTFDAEALEGFRDVHRGERVVIIGNGPSLNETDMTKLKSEYTFAVNGIFYAADRMGFDPTYYVVEDTAVMRDNLEQIKEYRAGHKFFPSIYRESMGIGPDITYFMMNRGFYEPSSPDYCIPRFSMAPSQRLYSGQSVTIINLQLAYHMGFSEVALIGMDFSYSVPDSAVVEGDVITSTGDDPNHFHPDYFGAGKVWKDPKLDRVLANYALAKEIFEADDRRIVNATRGGKLELFERVDYDQYIG